MASKYFHDLLNQVPDDLPDRHTTAKPATFAGEKVTVAVVRKALGSGSQPHRHPNVEQFNYVLEGRLRALVEDEQIEIGPGALVYIPANALHQTVAIGDGDCIYFMAKDAQSDKKLGIMGIPDREGANTPHYDPGFEPDKKK
jgi:quercetin dioxygenase-like cupin family protein